MHGSSAHKIFFVPKKAHNIILYFPPAALRWVIVKRIKF